MSPAFCRSLVTAIWLAMNSVAEARLGIMMASESALCISHPHASLYTKRVPFGAFADSPCAGPASFSLREQSLASGGGSGIDSRPFWEEGMGFAVAVFDVETFGWWEHGVQVSSKVFLVSLGSSYLSRKYEFR